MYFYRPQDVSRERIDDLMMEEEQHYVLENEERHLKISSDRDETEERDSIVVMRTDGRWGAENLD